MSQTANPPVISALQQKLSGVTGDSFLVLSVPAADAMTANVEAVRILGSEGFSGVYVALSKDYLSVSVALQKSGVDLSRIRFVDAISRMYGIAPVETEEVLYVDGPLSAEALVTGITESVRAIKSERRFVLLDSLTTILLYNSVESTVAFGTKLRQLLKREQAACIVVVAYMDSANQEIIEQIADDSSEIVSVTA